MALLLWLCLAGVVLALLSPIAPALAAMTLLKHAKSTANAQVFADIESFREISERLVRAGDAGASLLERVNSAIASIGDAKSGL